MAEHMSALRAVQRDTVGVPKCSDRLLIAAENAGLIEFRAWPSGFWRLTEKGHAYLTGAHDDR